MAASQAAAEVLYIRGLLREMGVILPGPTPLYVDNSGAVELSKDLKSCQRSRHIERRYLKVRELIAMGEVTVVYCPTADNHADVLTKALNPETHARHGDAMLNRALRDAAVPLLTPSRVQRTFDVESAYLKGKFESGEVLHCRPPRGFRTFSRGVSYVWRLKVPLYGEADAGRIWNRTLVAQLVRVQRFIQSQYDPCYFYKLLADDTALMHWVFIVLASAKS
jgi:hypothetical protein